MTLSELVARLGLAEVARRAGVSEATLRKWLRTGPSRAGASVLAGIIRRHLGSVKAAAKRKEGEKFRDELEPPPESELPPKKVLPPAAPTSPSIETEGTEPYNTDRYVGEMHILTVGRPVLEVDWDNLASFVQRIYHNSNRHYVRVRFLLFRYVTPGSPGRGGMVSRRGKWSEFWMSTHVQGSETGIFNEVATLIDEGPEMGKQSIRDLAQRRIIWLEQVHVHTFDDNETPTELATIVERDLR